MSEQGARLNTAEFIRRIAIVGNAVLFTCGAAVLWMAATGVLPEHGSLGLALMWKWLPLLLPFLFLGTLLRVGAWVAAGLFERQR